MNKKAGKPRLNPRSETVRLSVAVPMTTRKAVVAAAQRAQQTLSQWVRTTIDAATGGKQ